MTLKIGDKVRYRTRFLKSILAPPGSPLHAKRGIVIDSDYWLSVKWDDEDEPVSVRDLAIEHVDTPFVETWDDVDIAYSDAYGISANSKLLSVYPRRNK